MWPEYLSVHTTVGYLLKIPKATIFGEKDV